MTELTVLHLGSKSEQARALAAAINARLANRSLENRKVKVFEGEMTLTKELLAAAITCAWALGAQRSTLDAMDQQKIVPVGVTNMIRNPGRRSPEQMERGKKRIAHMRSQRKQRAKEAAQAKGARRAVCEHAKQAAANYRANPRAYHYLAGGSANLVYLKPTPTSFRSDCSQFVASIYKDCGLPSPGDVAHQWVNTTAMERCPHARITTNPKPGDLGMYGPHGATHHVELYVGEPGCEFIGHGSPPMDSLTPGRPSFYLTFDFLD
jgi:cell wall-associated NlpC family hydrolase